ncbi:MAG TPA: YggS family pyridoxal phosphate-dependent enzyme [Bacteroidales bacterium]|nr:YggS family pyridoxal phosphate-dependent enzyme [Bacteroidales bacterium]
MVIEENITRLRAEIPGHIKIVAVSKTMPAEIIQEAYNAGHRAFGENKVQELTEKHPVLPADIEWHMIGHLQTNKVKYIVPFISLIHSIDSLKLLFEINKEAGKLNRRIDCLLQIRIAGEETKFGMSMADAVALLDSDEFKNLGSIRITGLMGMATFTDDRIRVRNEFSRLAACFKELKSKFFLHEPSFAELSMGMSGDYDIAIETGATILRIGSLIFGERKKNN